MGAFRLAGQWVFRTFSTYLRADENDDELALEETDIDILNYFQPKTRGPRLFIESILDDKPTYPGLYEGYKVQQVIDARSFRTIQAGVAIEA